MIIFIMSNEIFMLLLIIATSFFFRFHKKVNKQSSNSKYGVRIVRRREMPIIDNSALRKRCILLVHLPCLLSLNTGVKDPFLGYSQYQNV